ncbi:hypothetical protein F2Q68_00033729 [Brassica cretica]|uniref:Uncharacterized protein n=1 Tax=Brassica cretica TaxID=69181 RepID=A0A8S9H325_BRACR|nr:hypothetical protein F2Q68_00033729 [Brassica cretica]
MDHLKLFKELHNFIFEPRGKLYEFKSNNNILVQRATANLSMHETLIFNEQDLSSNQQQRQDKRKQVELHQLHKDLQLWPHHPRPRQNVIHADMRSMESLYHTPSMCGKTRDGPGEARHGPRLKSEEEPDLSREEPDLSREEPYLSREEPNELASLWSGPVTRSKLRAQEKSL